MFKVSISNGSLSWSAQFSTQQEAESWLNSQIGKPHRLPERQVPGGELDAQGNPIMITLPAEFTSEIVDLSKDAAWVDQQINEKRKKEYPSIDKVVEALIEAIVENRPQKLIQIQAERQAVKNKHPKGN